METNYAVVGVAMEKVYDAKEIKYILTNVEKRSSYSLKGTQVKEVYRVKGAVAYRRRSLRSTTALFQFMLIKSGIIIFGHAHLHSCTDSRVL